MADGAPKRVRLLAEDLVAFRDTKGRVGLFREACSHRGASLYFGKNAEDGLRCWYHGWKYDVAGNCVDMPNEPPQTRFCEKIKHPAYPCIDKNGVIWTYMGPPEKQPAFPELDWTLAPESHVYVSKRYQDCHWLQGLEGDIDSSHLGFLHGIETMKKATEHGMGESREWLARSYPSLKVVERPGGLLHAARRDADEKNDYWRVGAWLSPCFTLLPGFPGDVPLGGHAWVPVDDTKVWTFAASWHPKRPLTEQELRFFREGTPTGIHSTMIPGTFIAKRNKSNGYAEPDAQGKQPWQRVTVFQDQDTAITESIGWNFDRGNEHLGSTDIVIARMRRRLIWTARELMEGKDPPIDGESYRLRGISCLLPRKTESWSDAVSELIDARSETFYPSV